MKTIVHEEKENGFIPKYLDDVFFDSLRKDYPEFDNWYMKSVHDISRSSHYWLSNNKLLAFLGFKIEDDEIVLENASYPKEKRIKITTIKSDNSLKSFSEFVIYLAIRKARKENIKQIYFSIIPNTNDKKKLLEIAKSYGFNEIGSKTLRSGGKEIFILKHVRRTDNWKTSYNFFPILKNRERVWTFLPIEASYHDNYLQNIWLDKYSFDFSKMGIKKAYIHDQKSILNLNEGDGLLIYLKKIGLTSVGLLVENKKISDFNDNFEEFKRYVKKYHAFLDDVELSSWFTTRKYITIFAFIRPLQSIIKYKQLKDNGFWPEDIYPSNIKLSDSDIKKILEFEKGEKDV